MDQYIIERSIYLFDIDILYHPAYEILFVVNRGFVVKTHVSCTGTVKP